MMMIEPRPQDRHPEDPGRLAYEAWWRDIQLYGDPIRRAWLVSEAFEAGWRAAMAEIKEAEAFLRKIRDEERREERRAQSHESRNAASLPDDWGALPNQGRTI